MEVPNDEEAEAMEEDVVGVSWYSLGFFEEKQPMAAVFLELDPQGAEEALAAGNEQKRHLTVAFDTPLEVAVDSKGRAPLARIHVPRCRTDYEVLRDMGLAERGQPLRI